MTLLQRMGWTWVAPRNKGPERRASSSSRAFPCTSGVVACHGIPAGSPPKASSAQGSVVICVICGGLPTPFPGGPASMPYTKSSTDDADRRRCFGPAEASTKHATEWDRGCSRCRVACEPGRQRRISGHRTVLPGSAAIFHSPQHGRVSRGWPTFPDPVFVGSGTCGHRRHLRRTCRIRGGRAPFSASRRRGGRTRWRTSSGRPGRPS